LRESKPNNNTSSRVRLEINLKAIRSNFNLIRSSVSPANVMVVLKADAYGLGIVPISKALCDFGAARIGVAEVKEAVSIRKLGVPIQVLGSLQRDEVPTAVKMNLVCPVTDYTSAVLISQEAKRQKKKIRIHFLIDTGMGRLGIPYQIAVEVIRKIQALPNLELEGMYSHFSNANNPRHPKSKQQLNLFKNIIKELKDINFSIVHMSNSDAINNLPESYFNMVRTGINLYGVFDLDGKQVYNLKPTLSLKTSLIAKRKLPAGSTIGYGCTHTLFKDTLVGTIPAGYADGIPLTASNSANVLVGTTECPVIGRVSMDYTTIDLSKRPNARVGDSVTIFGKSGNKEITVEDWARIKQTHPYDIICSLGNRVERVYKN